MTRFSSFVLAATALAATIGSTAPAVAAPRARDGYHLEFTPGPRGTARRVADRPAKPIQMADVEGHWRAGFGPRGTATWIPATHDRRAMPVERMADMEPATKVTAGAL